MIVLGSNFRYSLAVCALATRKINTHKYPESVGMDQSDGVSPWNSW
jgi:hypothetical protein